MKISYVDEYLFLRRLIPSCNSISDSLSIAHYIGSVHNCILSDDDLGFQSRIILSSAFSFLYDLLQDRVYFLVTGSPTSPRKRDRRRDLT